MKKISLLLLLLFSLMIGGCTITYSTNITEPPSVSNPDEENGEQEDNSQKEDNDSSGDDDTNNVQPSSPDIQAPIIIDSASFFYPNTLSINSDLIREYSYIYDNKSSQYTIYSAYYSQYYDTLYIAYDTVGTSTQTLKAKDLYQLERHALNYFVSDNNKTDYKDYLKAVLIYPDTLASSCRAGLTDDESIAINGCANYVGKEAVISLNRMSSIENFYESRKINISGLSYYQIEPMRYTFAHEFGHISTFYNMVYKNDENYEDYLKLRLGSKYTTIYPQGLPSSYNSQSDGYYTQPTEILADDYVELFYDTSKRAEEDTYDYKLENNYSRNSLKDYESLQNLSDNSILYNNVKNYYSSNFLNYSNKKLYSTPKVIQTSSPRIEYYESYSKIEKSGALKTISSNISVNLIAVGETTVNGTKYYRVILSNTFNTTNRSYDEKEVGKKMGYVCADDYSSVTNIKIYKINRNNNTQMMKNNMAPITDYSSTYFLPYYDFSYVLNLSSNNNEAIMYDYLNSNFHNQTYKIRIDCFGTLIN